MLKKYVTKLSCFMLSILMVQSFYAGYACAYTDPPANGFGYRFWQIATSDWLHGSPGTLIGLGLFCATLYFLVKGPRWVGVVVGIITAAVPNADSIVIGMGLTF